MTETPTRRDEREAQAAVATFIAFVDCLAVLLDILNEPEQQFRRTLEELGEGIEETLLAARQRRRPL